MISLEQASMRENINRLGAYYGLEPIAPIDPVEVQPVMLNPRAWPPCKHCGGNVHCEDYAPDMAAGLWEETVAKSAGEAA